MMTKISYRGYRFPPEIIQHAIWLYVRFTLNFRDIEDLLAGHCHVYRIYSLLLALRRGADFNEINNSALLAKAQKPPLLA